MRIHIHYFVPLPVDNWISEIIYENVEKKQNGAQSHYMKKKKVDASDKQTNKN